MDASVITAATIHVAGQVPTDLTINHLCSPSARSQAARRQPRPSIEVDQ
jgi:hypothetical protein